MSTHTDSIRKRLARLLPDLPLPAVDGVDPKIYQRVYDARDAFLQGFREALRTPPAVLLQFLHDEPFQRRGFALEGAAMALTLMDEFSPTSQSLLRVLLDGRPTEEHILGAIGVGWASARLGKSLDWLPATLHPCHKYAVANGYGFHQGFFHPHRFRGRGFPTSNGKLSTFYDIGLGRALWFIYIGNVDPIVHTIGKFSPDRHESLWCGVGTACAFTGNREYAAAEMGAAAARFKSHFCDGLETGTQLLCVLTQ